ncbi:MAG: ATP-binding protein [Bacteroidota bacterium]
MDKKSFEQQEASRLLTLQQLHILDSPTEKEFDEIIELAAAICEVPICVFSLVDENRQWFKACVGLSDKETSREISFCAHAIMKPDEPLIIEDANTDDRFKNNPLVTGNPHIVFYAGFPVLHKGMPMGTICVIDFKKRSLNALQMQAMKTFAQSIGQLLQLREDKQQYEKEKKLFTKALNLNSSYYLLIDQHLKIKEIGNNFKKSIPSIENNTNFYDHFKWHSNFDIESFLNSNKEDYGKLILMDAVEHKQRFKCSISKLEGHIIICAAPVINTQFKIEDYRIKTKDFSSHDSILEYLFLQETTGRNFAEAKEINQKITAKSVELEKLINQLQIKERELILSNIRIEEQKQFYSEILNNFPTDIAVFSTDHRYLFVNSRGIKDQETRDFMIGRTDYDYCDLRKIDYSIADKRREQFNKVVATKNTVEWEDAYPQADGSNKYILRRFAPVLNSTGDLISIIGYGIEITELKNYQIQIEKQNESIKNINENLEQIVIEKTQKNNELTQMLSHQDKLAMVGEITAGITHDLNTPLGAIKVGSESLKYTLEELFSHVLEPTSMEQVAYACNAAQNQTYDLFIGGMQTKKESESFKEVLEQFYPELSSQHKKLSEGLVKARVSVDDTEGIRWILQFENRLAFLELIYVIKAIRFFIDTILQASDRASGVIKNLRFYLKEGSITEMSNIDLLSSIQTVLSIFSHEIKKGIELQLDVPKKLQIFGYEAKIYQLWSNIIKNALDAMKSKGIILIKAKETTDKVIVEISNNGPEIPAEIKEKIFDKFFTTKDESSGTGLGLNIVKQSVEEHRGQISVASDPNLTTFTISIPKLKSL